MLPTVVSARRMGNRTSHHTRIGMLVRVTTIPTGTWGGSPLWSSEGPKVLNPNISAPQGCHLCSPGVSGTSISKQEEVVSKNRKSTFRFNRSTTAQ